MIELLEGVWCSYGVLGSTRLFFFFFNDTATTEIYTLSLHDALPICIIRIRRMTLRRGGPVKEAKAAALEEE